VQMEVGDYFYVLDPKILSPPYKCFALDLKYQVTLKNIGHRTYFRNLKMDVKYTVRQIILN
jgi:hypothetical protein